MPSRPVVPPGVQPEQNGRIQCLECGNWYKLLGQHLRLSHDITVDEYKRDHQLHASRGLVPEQLRETMRGHAQRRYATDPNLRAALTHDLPTMRARQKIARKAFDETARRAGVLRNLQDSAARNGQLRSDAIRAAHDERARSVGYADFADLLAKTAHQPSKTVGALVGQSALQIRKWRIKYGITSTAKEHAMAQRHAAKAASLVPPDLPPGEQPERAGKLQCRECSRWYRSLTMHLSSHDLDADAYRARHGLRHGQRLVAIDLVEASRKRFTGLLDSPAMQANRAGAAQRLQRSRDKAIAASREAAARPEVIAHRDAARLIANRVRIEQAAARHDARARELGHPDLAAFLAATAHLTQREAATVFGVSVTQIGRFRAAAT